ncbi:M1 family metallopeptidase [Neobacillus niacini]|uniref:M1 family metallopeptidase n=1 Tax=Neobacillus niacini TaxID=86668 RepID=UPI0021CB7500|nr:M1 family metallopeptidase [Neobacillus niacini]MCM3765544.1 M1 family metallopeptidase [Neobacillus niacini]
MFLYLVIFSLAGALFFLGWTLLTSKKNSVTTRAPKIGLGFFLILFLGSLILLEGADKNVTALKKEKAMAQPQTEENKPPENQPKEEEKSTTPEKADDLEEHRVQIVNGPGSKTKGPANLNYFMDVSYDSFSHLVSGTMSVEFINNLDVDLNNLYFNVWGNAKVFLAAAKKDANVEIDQVQVNGQPVSHTLDGTALHIPDVPIKKGEKAKVEMNFSVALPEGQDRFGWSKTTTSLGNWFPILAVYDDEGWNVDPYFPSGESFYSLTGNFEVTFTTEKEQVIATTGTEVGEPKINGALATHHYKAENVRDFAMELDPNYKIKQAKAGKVNINVYYKEEHAKFVDTMLNAGTKSIALFSEKFGQYPWPELDITAMEGWFGGMEYPQLVMITIAPEIQVEGVASTTAHEIGHQWFYGIIGNNEYDEPWLDESFASFAAMLHDGLEQTPFRIDNSRLGDWHLSHSIEKFKEKGKEGTISYYNMAYRYGAKTVDDLRKELGDEQFYASMHAYFNEMKFGVSSTADFIRIMEETSKRDLDKFFEDHKVFVSDQQ